MEKIELFSFDIYWYWVTPVQEVKTWQHFIYLFFVKLEQEYWWHMKKTSIKTDPSIVFKPDKYNRTKLLHAFWKYN